MWSEATVAEVGGERVSSERCALCLSEMLSIVGSEGGVDGGDVVKALPFCVWVFWVSGGVGGNFNVIEVALEGGFRVCF